jgi:hypothetical protein
MFYLHAIKNTSFKARVSNRRGGGGFGRGGGRDYGGRAGGSRSIFVGAEQVGVVAEEASMLVSSRGPALLPHSSGTRSLSIEVIQKTRKDFI